ncbi:unnamed protein product [Aspergillus oryzae]|uniref:Unnamed protein product n=1 Tax=Aspergillus oryzae TaxID=5062 RepID=A0AAN4Y7L1_ASPOZ|nr:unnamed protein product [Aspergillus oryzae]
MRHTDRVRRSTGLKSLDISLEQQTVSVVAEPSLSFDAVLAAIKGKGKDVHSGEIDGVPQPIKVKLGHPPDEVLQGESTKNGWTHSG